MTAATPKELLPVAGVPALQWVLDEAIAAGVERIVVVSSTKKPAIAAYLNNVVDTAEMLRQQGRGALAERLAAVAAIETTVVYQDEPRGLGHAIATAEHVVGQEPFYVLLPDELYTDALTLQAIRTTLGACNTVAVALRDVPAAHTSRYGIAEVSGRFSNPTAWGPARPFQVSRFTRVMEKPAPGRTKSTSAVIGRYGLTPNIFAALGEVRPGAAGEIQLTDALALLAADAGAYGVFTSTPRFDIGTPDGLMIASTHLTLIDDELSGILRGMIERTPRDRVHLT